MATVTIWAFESPNKGEIHFGTTGEVGRRFCSFLPGQCEPWLIHPFLGEVGKTLNGKLSDDAVEKIRALQPGEEVQVSW